MQDHGLQEEAIVKSGFPFHILRPVGLTDGVATGKVLVQNAGFLPNNSIARADVALYLVESLLSDRSASLCKCCGFGAKQAGEAG
ncbi:MAG: NAD(P)H-binding protein [Bacteroidetes bacterium]|nr:NAD(P)H-binding protein [Bacteroidota bacterium]